MKRRTELETKKRELEAKKQAAKDPSTIADIDTMTEDINKEWSRLEKQIKDQCAQIETVKNVSFYFHREYTYKIIQKATKLKQTTKRARIIKKTFVHISLNWIE